MTNVAVIGAGAAGLVAALRAAQGGARVTVLAKGYGATAFSTGLVDVLGYTPDGKPVDEPWLLLSEGQWLGHPYRLAGAAAGVLREAIAFFAAAAAEGGLPYACATEGNGYFATTLGTFKPSFCAPLTCAQGNLRDLDGRILVVGFKECPDMAPDFVAASLNDLRPVLPWGTTQDLEWVSQEVSLPFLDGRRVTRGREIADLLDDEENLLRLLEILRPLVAADRYTAVAFPPVLGFKRAVSNIEMLQRDLGLKVFELLPGPHSVPGQRLVAALCSALAARGGVVQLGAAVERLELGARGCRHAVLKAKPGAWESVEAESWVVATGDFIGGGLRVSQGELSAPALGLRWTPPEGGWQEECLTGAGHPLLREGIRVDAELHPLTATDKPVAPNVFAAGALLAGYDYTRELSGLGVAILTGFLAGTHALQSAGEGVSRI